MNPLRQWQDAFGEAKLRSWQDSFSSLEAAPVETPIIWSPTNRQQRAVNLHSAYLVFQNDMAKIQKYPEGQEGQLAAWRVARDDWAKWYGNTSFTTWLLSSTDTILDGYEKALAGWRDWYATNIGVPSGQGPTSYVNTPIIPSTITVNTPDIPKAVESIKASSDQAQGISDYWKWVGALAGAGALSWWFLRRPQKNSGLGGGSFDWSEISKSRASRILNEYFVGSKLPKPGEEFFTGTSYIRNNGGVFYIQKARGNRLRKLIGQSGR